MGQIVSGLFGGGKSKVDPSILEAQRKQDEDLRKREAEEEAKRKALLKVAEGGGTRRFTLFSGTGEQGVSQKSPTLGAS